jgi:di/tricarboxylate transporter
LDAILVAGLLTLATLLLVSERLRADLVALLVLAALVGLRLVEPAQALSGFSNPATVTIACMFVISAALSETGLVGYLGDRLLLHGPTRQGSILLLAAAVIATLSAFINNTAVVAVFLPLLLRACQGNQISPSRIMMPLSFFAMLGGTCTLIGTSTNILVDSIAQEQGIAPFQMFEFSAIGLILLAVGTVYILLVARRTIPETIPAESPDQDFHLNRYLSEVIILEDSPLIGQTVLEARIGERFELEVLAHGREGEMHGVRAGLDRLKAGDLLLVNGSADALMRLNEGVGLAVKPGRHPDVADLKAADAVVLEAVITPTSDLEGRTLKSIGFRNRFGATALAVRRHGLNIREKIGRLRLAVGDELLILAPRQSLDRLKQQTSFLILQELELPTLKPLRALVACAITAAIVVVATLGWFEIVEAAVVGAVLLVLTGCISRRNVYRSIDWQVIFLLAGLIPLGVAMQTSGAAEWAVEWLLRVTGDLGPHAVLSIFFLLTTILTGFMSNTATAALLAPLCITSAQKLGVDPRPFLFGLAFAASAAFWTPVGYQTNLLVYSPGGYRFRDFVKVGGPLTLIVWILCSLLIPLVFPF